MGGLHEKCAVVGVSLGNGEPTEAARITYQALFALQHRGVEASGIATNAESGGINAVRKLGMVRDVYRENDLQSLTGSVAVGHNRYSTNGSKNDHASPITNSDTGDAQAHNGNLPITASLDDRLSGRGYRVNQYNDSGRLGKTIFLGIAESGGDILAAIRPVVKEIDGAYSCAGIHDDTMYAFRDPHGIRPLEIGCFDGGIVVASETCALDTIGAEHLRSVNPGELVIARDGLITATHQLRPPTPHLDMFELVYFARHDSYLNGQRVNEVRRRFGQELAALHPSRSGAHNSMVVPVPDTSVPAAEGYAEELGLPHTQAIIKNRYVGRTFMQPSQASRRSSLQLKHTMISERIAGKDVYLVDDSIVRGNTMPRLIKLARTMGARSVSVVIASPPVRFPDFYGIDTPAQTELIAAHMAVEEMRREFGADYLGFLTLGAMVRATRQPAEQFNLAAFTGEYPVSIGEHARAIKAPVSWEYID